MSRHEVEARAVRRLPDGTVEEMWVREAYDDSPAWPALGAGQTEANRRTPAVVGVVAVLCTGVFASIVVVALAVLP